MERKLNRHVPAALPPHRMLSRFSNTLPLVVDLRPWDSPVKDQGDEGSCTAHAGTSSREWIVRKYFPSQGPLVFSPQYTYAKELISQGGFPQDDGSDGTTLCNTLIVDGCCCASLYPYVSGQIDRPTADQDLDAAKHTLGAWHGVAGSNTALSVLGDPVPWPVMMGFSVYQGLMSDECAATGVMPLPGPEESSIGGHEVKLSGYDVGLAPTLRPQNCPPAVLVQNSWGTGWALKGYFWCPLPILDALDTDLKIAHSGHPWR
jgi:Papain family cysteine protease